MSDRAHEQPAHIRCPSTNLAPVASDSSVCGLSLDSLSIRRDEHGGHEAERSVALRDDIGLHITVVVLARPHESARALECLRDLVVDEPVLVLDAELIELLLVRLLVLLLEDVLESPVVLLHDRVLGREVEGPLLHQRVLEARLSEAADRLIGVVHADTHAALRRVVEHLPLLHLRTILRRERHLERARAIDGEVGTLVLITERVTPDHNRRRPARNDARHVLHDDGLHAEHTASEYDSSASRRPR